MNSAWTSPGPVEVVAPLRPIGDLLEDIQRVLQKELTNIQGRSRTGLLEANDIATLARIVQTLKAIEAKIGDAGDEKGGELTTERLKAIAAGKK